MKTEVLFYEFVRHWPGLALQPAGLDSICAKGYEFSSEEIKQSA
jgi:hypothetical protein